MHRDLYYFYNSRFGESNVKGSKFKTFLACILEFKVRTGQLMKHSQSKKWRQKVKMLILCIIVSYDKATAASAFSVGGD